MRGVQECAGLYLSDRTTWRASSRLISRNNMTAIVQLKVCYANMCQIPHFNFQEFSCQKIMEQEYLKLTIKQ
jgi:hypothetical protein